jgi:hypothetical protein
MSEPSSAANGTAISPLPVKPHVDDLFATLFAPATPPASPRPLGSPSIFSPPPSARSQVTSISTASSTESDFGAFVSVPPSEDPLAPPSSRSEPSSPPPPTARRRLSAEFFAEAKAATARNQQGLLVELLEHEDDPMYWHKSTASQPTSIGPSGTVTPQQPPAPSDDNTDILAPLVEPVKAVVGPLLDALTEATSDNAFSPPPAPAAPPPPVEFVNVSRHRSASSSPPHLRSPSLPPSPSRPTPPVLTRTESMTSTFSSPSQPSRWVSSFLTYRGPPPHPTPSISPAPTVPQARVGPKRTNITHGSPFASTPFTPASGAPGFDGDRAWNKGFDEDGKSLDAIERRGVQLVGRKESTRAVLGTALANTVRTRLSFSRNLSDRQYSCARICRRVRVSLARGRYSSASTNTEYRCARCTRVVARTQVVRCSLCATRRTGVLARGSRTGSAKAADRILARANRKHLFRPPLPAIDASIVAC